MLKWTIVATSAVLSLPLVISSGVAVAQQFVCDPHCSPAYNNQRLGQGIVDNANVAVNGHRQDGRAKALLKQENSVPGYVPPSTTEPPAPVPSPSTTTTTTTTDPTLSSTPTLDPTLSPSCSLC